MHPGARQGEVQRLVVRLIDAPLPLRPRFAPPTGTILLTDDRQGTARNWPIASANSTSRQR